MSVTNRKGPVIESGVCRCCGSIKKCRILNVEYEWIGQKEMYSDMFFDTFGLLLSHMEGTPEERLICATCVTRLRAAKDFRRQVLQCEEMLLQRIQNGGDTDLQKEVKIEIDMKEEVLGCAADGRIDDYEQSANDHNYDENYDSEDNLPLVKVERRKPHRKAAKKEKPLKNKHRTKDKNRDNKYKKALLNEMQELNKKWQEVHNYDNYEENQSYSTSKLDNEDKSFLNACTFVETSYICPFDSTYSDYRCFYCREMCLDPNKLREHTLTHNPTEYKALALNKKWLQIDVARIDCRLCPEPVNDLETLKNHLKLTHEKTIYECPNSFLKFHLTANNLSCLECGAKFRFFHILLRHMAEHFGKCICDICGSHFFNERKLYNHQKSHQKVEMSFTCKDCGKTFKSKHSRDLHEARTHRKEAVYDCSRCDEIFFSYSLRYRHMIDVHGEQRLYQCDHCEKAYDSRKSLREHTRRSHLKVFKHSCELCDKRFYLPSRLKEHMVTHTGERNFRCDYCGKSYPRLRGLKVHMQSHSSDKKYKCDLCNASFTQNVNLKNHVKRQHQNLELEDGFHD